MKRIQTKIDTNSDEFKSNSASMKSLVKELHSRLEEVKKGGPPQHVERHKKRGKLTARERIAGLLDPDSPFLELNPLAAYNIYKNDAPSAGIITGVGVVHGREVLVISNDATVKGGTYYPLTIAKHIRAQEVAMDNNLPCVYLVDSGGVFLPLQDGVFPDKEHFGRIFYNQALLSAKGIPQLSSVMGSCTAGGAYVPAMSDETVIVRKQGTIFIGGPPLVKAATGAEVTAEELGGADVHCRISGVSDYYAENDEHALKILRDIIENLNRAPKFEI
ncbi:MAG: methylcrotonoyl-CoA carboxylase, partial [Calditrichaeota bacterium]|nr:methylcrotonoyl-CoA carboxylase [Calditrichota bacterium]